MREKGAKIPLDGRDRCANLARPLLRRSAVLPFVTPPARRDDSGCVASRRFALQSFNPVRVP